MRRGKEGEKLAREYLERAGFLILAENFCVRGGELDLVGRAPSGQLVFFEVKWRARAPVEHSELLPWRKRVCLRRAIAGWLEQNGAAVWQCDLLLLVLVAPRQARVFWYRDVFRFDQWG